MAVFVPQHYSKLLISPYGALNLHEAPVKICVAQLKSKAGDVEFNIIEHLKLIDKAINSSVDIICFPELSLTGYEPALANSLSTSLNDTRFDPFQKLSDENKIIICAGMPIKANDGILIGLIIFQPKKSELCTQNNYCMKMKFLFLWQVIIKY